MQLSFTKMHGLGNDFIVFEASSATLPDAAQFRALADRRTGIGFDQALVIQPPRQPDTDLFYRIFNADGSEVQQCGNGARCLASLVGQQRGRQRLSMESPGGLINAELLDDGQVTLNMGIPDFTPAALPFMAEAESPLYDIDVAGQILQIGAVSMGNPHAVLMVPDVDAAAVESVGPLLERHPRFPQRVNVGFMQVVSREQIYLRVFERGVGETQACGTGACAAVAVGRQLGLLAAVVQVRLPGGALQIRWSGPGSPLYMTGPAVTAYTGQISI